MKTVPLSANQREGIGKQQAKKLRGQKRIPAVLYGSGIKTTSIDVSLDDFSKAIHTKAGENVIIKLTVSGPKKVEKNVVIKEIQHNPVTEGINHIDFNAISMTEKIKVKVPLHVEGEAAGVKEGGIMDVVHHEIEVECLPTDIPEKLTIDVSELAIGQSVQIQQITFSSGVIPTLGPEDVVAAVHAPRAEEEPAAEEAPTEPELIGKKKDDEEAPAEGEAAPKKEAASEAKKEAGKGKEK